MLKNHFSKSAFIFGILAFIANFGSNSSEAADLTDKTIVSPYIGTHTFDGERNLKFRPEFGIGLEKFYGDSFSLGISAGYVPTKSRASGSRKDIYTYNLFASHSFYKKNWAEKLKIPVKNLIPYVSFGIGGNRAVGINAGVGIRALKNDRMAFKLEARGFELWKGRHDLVVSAGIDYLFGGKKQPPVVETKPVPKPKPKPKPKAKVPVVYDSDFDGVPDDKDKCPNTPMRAKVDANGCPLDSDKDGVPDYKDKCPYTLWEVPVDENGCEYDTDKDTIPDYRDKCPNTPAGVMVDDDGCPLDADNDGVPNDIDKCPNTPAGMEVDANGCPKDSDKDGVPDYMDKCPNTPEGYTVNKDGCFVAATLKVYFDFNSAKIKPQYYPEIEKFAKFLKKNPKIKVEIQGHTDSIGSDEYNLKLSQKRAEAVRDLLIKKYGISPDRLTAKGYGETKPIAPNSTPEGRAKNRRVEAVLIIEVK